MLFLPCSKGAANLAFAVRFSKVHMYLRVWIHSYNRPEIHTNLLSAPALRILLESRGGLENELRQR